MCESLFKGSRVIYRDHIAHILVYNPEESHQVVLRILSVQICRISHKNIYISGTIEKKKENKPCLLIILKNPSFQQDLLFPPAKCQDLLAYESSLKAEEETQQDAFSGFQLLMSLVFQEVQGVTYLLL